MNFDWLQRILYRFRRFQFVERLMWKLWGWAKCPMCIMEDDEEWLNMCDCFVPLGREIYEEEDQ